MESLYRGAVFLKAAARLSQAPADEGWEVAFAGRSNAGKSSVINTLCHRRQLARTSKTPGRTQQLLFFRLDDRRRLVDLPGYGYARVSESVRARWQASMGEYLTHRHSLAGLVLVMDIRHPLTESDRQMLAWSRTAGIPLSLLLTKSDKLKRGPAEAQLARVRRAVSEAVPVILFSSLHRQGLEPLYRILDRWLDSPTQNDPEEVSP